MKKNYKNILVRCLLCEEQNKIDSKISASIFLPITESYPVKLHGYRFDPKEMTQKEILEDIFLCEKHFKKLFKNNSHKKVSIIN